MCFHKGTSVCLMLLSQLEPCDAKFALFCLEIIIIGVILQGRFGWKSCSLAEKFGSQNTGSQKGKYLFHIWQGGGWNGLRLLGLLASLLAGRTASLPQLLPGSGHQTTKNTIWHSRKTNLPFTGGCSSPALSAMQVPIPDF